MIDEEKLLKGITAYALDDWLRFKLGRSLIGVRSSEEEYDHFIDAVSYLSKRPAIRRMLSNLTDSQMIKLLEALEDRIK